MQQYIVVMSMDIGCKGQKTLALVTIASLGGMSHSWSKLSVTHLLNYPCNQTWVIVDDITTMENIAITYYGA